MLTSRAGELKWRGVPPGMPSEIADALIAKLRDGSTIRKLTCGMKQFGSAMVPWGASKSTANCIRSGLQWRGAFQGQHGQGKRRSTSFNDALQSRPPSHDRLKCIHRWIARQAALPRLQTNRICICASDGR
jgi:hypothetical protein